MLTYIHPDNLHSCWEFVKEGLARIQSRSPDRWKQEDVYVMVKNGSMVLYLANERDGFAILQPCKGWDAPEVFVFAAYIVPGKDLMDAAMEEIFALAKNAGAVRVKFQSLRAGWGRKAKKKGWKQGHVEFELELT